MKLSLSFLEVPQSVQRKSILNIHLHTAGQSGWVGRIMLPAVSFKGRLLFALQLNMGFMLD